MREFNRALKDVVECVKKKKFSHAVALFSKVDGLWEDIPLFRKTKKLKKEMQLMHEELFLYLRVNEAYLMAETGNLAGLRDELDHIHTRLYEDGFPVRLKPLEDYITKNYKFCLEVYRYRVGKKSFEDVYQKIKAFSLTHRADKALKHYSDLVIIFHKLHDYLEEDEREEYYQRLKSLYTDISLAKLMDIAVKKQPTIKVTSKTRPRVVAKKMNKIRLPQDQFKKVRDYIKKGSVAEASDVLDHI